MSVLEALQEASAAKAEYVQLFEQFKLSNQLFEEREALYRQQVEHYKQECDVLHKTSLELRYEVRLQRSVKKAFEKDVLLLEQASQSLENREIDIANRLEDVSARNSELEIENASLISDNTALRKTIKNDMIGVEEYHSLSRRVESNEIKIASMVPKETHGKVVDRLADLKRRVENDFISLEEYNRLRERHAMDQTNMASLVPVRDYNKLLFKYEALEAQLQDMVPREKHSLVVDKLVEVQRRVENDMVGVVEYREALAAGERARVLAENQLEEQRHREANTVPVKDYNKLLFKYEALESRVGEDFVPREALERAEQQVGRARESLAEMQRKVDGMMGADEFKKVVASSEGRKLLLEREQAKTKEIAEKLATSEATAGALQRQLDKETKAHEATVKAIKAQYERLYAQVGQIQEANSKLHDGSVAEYEGMIEEMAEEMRALRRQVYDSSVDQRVLEEMQGRMETAERAAEKYKVVAEEARAQLAICRRDMDLVHSAVILDLLHEEGLVVDGGGSKGLLHFPHTSPILEEYYEAVGGDVDRRK